MENKVKTSFCDLNDFERYTDTHEKCHNLLIQMRWQGVPKCPDCGSDKSYFIRSRYIYKCANKSCKRVDYSVTQGTFMQNTKLPLNYWFSLIVDFCRDMSANKVSKTRNINYRTVWLVFHKLRNAISFHNDAELRGVVKLDEIIFGPKPENDLRLASRIARHNKKEKRKKKEAEERGEKYTMVHFGHQKVILTACDSQGHVIAKILGSSKKSITKQNLQKIFDKNIDKNATIHMDSHPIHKEVNLRGRKVEFITHTLTIELKDDDGNVILNENGKPKTVKRKNYVNENGMNTNAVENINSLMISFLRKHCKITHKYGHLYMSEFSFHRTNFKLNFLEKLRIVLCNTKRGYISMKDLKKLENKIPEKKWVKKRKVSRKHHSRKKKVKLVDFSFPLFESKQKAA